MLDLIGRENIFMAQPRFGASLKEAVVAAEQWIAQGSHPNTRLRKDIL